MFKEFKAPAAFNPVQRAAWYVGLVIAVVFFVTAVALTGRGLVWLWQLILGV